MNAIEKNSFTDFLTQAATHFPHPRAIVVISAHWETQGTKILSTQKPKTIHDFGGFPPELYEIQYPALGDTELAEKIARELNLKTDMSWGLDHGTWTVLKYLYPKADIPVLQLSIDQNLTLLGHYEMGAKLRKFRDEGVLFLGSGNITHNLRRIDFSSRTLVPSWAKEFDLMIKTALEERNLKVLAEIDRQPDLWKLAHPTLEHYIPALYIYGLSTQEERVQFLFEGMELSSLSMRSFLF